MTGARRDPFCDIARRLRGPRRAAPSPTVWLGIPSPRVEAEGTGTRPNIAPRARTGRHVDLDADPRATHAPVAQMSSSSGSLPPRHYRQRVRAQLSLTTIFLARRNERRPSSSAASIGSVTLRRQDTHLCRPTNACRTRRDVQRVTIALLVQDVAAHTMICQPNDGALPLIDAATTTSTLQASPTRCCCSSDRPSPLPDPLAPP